MDGQDVQDNDFDFLSCSSCPSMLLRFALALALIATMFEPSSNIFFGHGSDGCTDSLAQVRRGAWLLTAHEGLDLEPAVLARREVRRVSRQPDHFGLRLGG